jgi:type I restriction enzyme S subunit
MTQASATPETAGLTGWKPYPAYRESGVAWLGRIPKHWEVKRLKYLASEPLKYGASEVAELRDPDQPRFVRITDITESGELREETFRSLTEDTARPYLLEQGDLLFARSGATVGKTFMYDRSWGRACFAGYLIRFRAHWDRALPEFVSYFANSADYWCWLSANFIKATIQNVSAERYANLAVPVPSLPEQQAIVGFLDRETGKMDAMVERKERLIELLLERRAALISHAVTKGLNANAPLRDSGIAWLGKFPKQWEVKRLKHLARLRSGDAINTESITEHGEFPVFGGNGIRGFAASYSYEGDFVLIGRQGALCGNINYASGRFWASEHAVVVEPRAQFATRWLGELLRVMNINQYSISAAQPGLSVEMISQLKIPVPPLPEQKAIAVYLSLEFAKLDALIARIRDGIAALREYRTALISAAVTGRITVDASASH